MFYYVLFNECPSFVFCALIFYIKIVLWIISYVANTLAAKMVIRKIPDMGSALGSFMRSKCWGCHT